MQYTIAFKLSSMHGHGTNQRRTEMVLYFNDGNAVTVHHAFELTPKYITVYVVEEDCF
jgi:hypothetical protein